MLGRPCGLRCDQLNVEGQRDAVRDVVLQGEEIAHLAVEPLGPEVSGGFGVN